jgi:hypothetical protein
MEDNFKMIAKTFWFWRNTSKGITAISAQGAGGKNGEF